MKNRVAIVNVAGAEEAAKLAELPLEATIVLSEVAGAINDGLLGVPVGSPAHRDARDDGGRISANASR